MPLSGETSPGPLSDEIYSLKLRLEALEIQSKAGQHEGVTLLVFSGELDKLLAAFTVAVGAAACGLPVSMFFTFWGAAALKQDGPQSVPKSAVERMFGWLLPGGLQRRRLSRLDMAGMGRAIVQHEMRLKQVPDLPGLVAMAAEAGVRLYFCETTMHLMGIRMEEIIDYPHRQVCGVAKFVDLAADSRMTLFI